MTVFNFGCAQLFFMALSLTWLCPETTGRAQSEGYAFVLHPVVLPQSNGWMAYVKKICFPSTSCAHGSFLSLGFVDVLPSLFRTRQRESSLLRSFCIRLHLTPSTHISPLPLFLSQSLSFFFPLPHLLPLIIFLFIALLGTEFNFFFADVSLSLWVIPICVHLCFILFGTHCATRTQVDKNLVIKDCDEPISQLMKV